MHISGVSASRENHLLFFSHCASAKVREKRTKRCNSKTDQTSIWKKKKTNYANSLVRSHAATCLPSFLLVPKLIKNKKKKKKRADRRKFCVCAMQTQEFSRCFQNFSIKIYSELKIIKNYAPAKIIVYLHQSPSGYYPHLFASFRHNSIFILFLH